VLEESKDNVTSLLTTDHEVITGCLDGRVRRYDLRMGQLNTDCVGSKTASQAISVCVCSPGWQCSKQTKHECS